LVGHQFDFSANFFATEQHDEVRSTTACAHTHHSAHHSTGTAGATWSTTESTTFGSFATGTIAARAIFLGRSHHHAGRQHNRSSNCGCKEISQFHFDAQRFAGKG
jgi:hypothetical protein